MRSTDDCVCDVIAATAVAVWHHGASSYFGCKRKPYNTVAER
jgi:hypothetical protein